MELSQLAARQKRFRQWQEFLNIPNIPTHLSHALRDKLSVYGNLLLDIWKNPKPDSTEQTEIQILGLEKELEQINEQIRLNVSTTLGREYNK